MIKLIKKLFTKKQYKLLGRGGISYSSGQDVCYLDTNNFIGKSYEIEIFYKDIKLVNSDKVLSESDKKTIATIVKKLLKNDGIKADILPH